MTESQWHLAQLNVGRLLAPIESPDISGFVAQLEPINALADADPGMVWRLQTDAGNATSIRPTEDDLFLINMSVWTSLQALRAFTYTTAHVHVLRERRSWFERLATAHLVLWWVPAGHIPTVDEALDRLERLRRDGPRPAAFTFRTPFEPRASARRIDGRCRFLLAGARRVMRSTGRAAREVRRPRVRGSRTGP